MPSGISKLNAMRMKERIEKDIIKLNIIFKELNLSEQYELKKKKK